MAKRVIKGKLSVSGIENMKKELLAYKNDELRQKTELLIMRLAEIGVEVANKKVSESPLGKTANVTFKLSGATATIIASGEIKKASGREPFNTILAIEFGAGIHYNSGNKHPDADKLGLGVGTFPGQIHAFEDGWYYWDEKLEKWRYTHGVKATMPLHEAEKEIILKALKVAREVFR